MNKTTTIAIALIFGFVGFLAGTFSRVKESAVADEAARAITGETTFKMLEDVTAKHAEAGKRYEIALASARSGYRYGNFDEFETAQKAWETFREAELDLQYSSGGSFAPVRANLRDIELLTDRIRDLTRPEGEM